MNSEALGEYSVPPVEVTLSVERAVMDVCLLFLILALEPPFHINIGHGLALQTYISQNHVGDVVDDNPQLQTASSGIVLRYWALRCKLKYHWCLLHLSELI